jgi:hypothetical protein
MLVLKRDSNRALGLYRGMIAIQRFRPGWTGLRLAALALGASVALGGGEARSRTLADCEAIKDTHAYNLCLASFGPRRGQRALTGQPRAEGPGGRVHGRKATATRPVQGLAVQHISGGRVRASVDVGAPRRAPR